MKKTNCYLVPGTCTWYQATVRGYFLTCFRKQRARNGADSGERNAPVQPRHFEHVDCGPIAQVDTVRGHAKQFEGISKTVFSENRATDTSNRAKWIEFDSQSNGISAGT